MSFAIAGLKVPGVKILEPGCVNKSFPEFSSNLKNLLNWQLRNNPDEQRTTCQPVDPREEPLSAAARLQSGGLVSMGMKPSHSPKIQQAIAGQYRIRHLPLVPRDGT